MTETAANVLVGATGKIYGAPTGTTLPTHEVEGLNVAFFDLGYISDAGVTQSIGKTVTVIKAWGGDVIRKVASDHDLTYKFTMLETNPNSLETYYGDQTDAATVTKIHAGVGIRQAWVIDVLDGTNLVRIAIPDGEIMEVGDVVYATTAAIEYPVTMSCYPDTSANKAYKYVHDLGAS